MKEKWTKLGKSLICLALVTSMLAGCGGGGNSSSSSEKQTSGGTSGEVAAGDDNFNETGLPIVKEPVELTFLYVKGANTMDLKTTPCSSRWKGHQRQDQLAVRRRCGLV